MSADTITIVDLDRELQAQTPQQVLTYALSQYDNLAISFSGAEDVVLIDMAVKIRPDIAVFTLDTGRLHSETYRFIEKVREHYKVQIDVLFPDSSAVNKLVREKGLFSFYRDNHQECCSIRKVLPLKEKLLELDAWVTGQRRDQSDHRR